MRVECDALDRVSVEALYGAGGVLHSSTSAAYGGLQVTITDPRSNASLQIANAWGELVRLVDAASGQTNYQYDAFGQLKQATDAYGTVVSQVTYNLRGMRTAITDVDLGAWSFTPNALGEIVSQTDAKSQTASFRVRRARTAQEAHRGGGYQQLDLGSVRGGAQHWPPAGREWAGIRRDLHIRRLRPASRAIDFGGRDIPVRLRL
jgi:YD repeat-containing protein